MTSSSPPGLSRFNAADDEAARATLYEICTSAAWAGELLTRRPYPDAEALFAASDTAVARLTPADLAEAMAGHPPIGRPRPGDPVSAREQHGMAGAPEALKSEMLELNLAYQEKFGQVFLICATGLTAGQLRDAVRDRIANTPDREREIVRRELGRINRVRLAGLVARPTVSTHILDTSTGRPAGNVTVRLSVRGPGDPAWTALGTSVTDADGRCKDLPLLPQTATHARLLFEVEPHLSQKQAEGAAFFPEVTVAFAVAPGEHHHVPLLLTPFGYSVYRGS